MNETLILEIIFWSALFMVFYTYLGYGIVLYALVKLKELFVKPVKRVLPPDSDLPEVTLFITAFNEEDVVDEKMENSLALDYPADKLRIVWVTDGSDDGTNDRLQTRWNGKATVYFQPKRQGKTAAMTRGMTLVRTPLVVFTDANTMVTPFSMAASSAVRVRGVTSFWSLVRVPSRSSASTLISDIFKRSSRYRSIS